MKKISFGLKTLTPVFCSKAPKDRAELRPASFKGLMRYWYRALKAEDDLDELKEEESKIFGSTKQGASFRFRIKDFSEINNDQNRIRKCPLPHKKEKVNFALSAIKPGVSCEVEFGFKSKGAGKLVEKVFDITLMLGGIGQRARRGFGSLERKEWKFLDSSTFLTSLKENLNYFSSRQWIAAENRLKRSKTEKSNYKYPVLEEIIVGRNGAKEEILKRIGNATSDHRDKVLGSGSPRMASPIYVTINRLGDNFYPVISRLTPNYPTSNFSTNKEKLDNFINELR
jgi:CRISPR-associated protein Cmr1